MDTPGVSLFQGSDSIKLNSSNQREEEEEFIAEERKRKVELNNLFQNAFDDLIEEEDDDDEASTPNSSRHSARDYSHHYSGSFGSDTERSYSSLTRDDRHQHQIYQSVDDHENNRIFNHISSSIPAVNGNISDGSEGGHPRYYPGKITSEKETHVDAYKRAEIHSMEQLKVLYDVRMREIERLKKELDAERNGKDQILRKLNICETEKSGILSSNKQIAETLELSNKKVKELESEVCILKDEMKKVEDEHEKRRSEVEILKMENLNLKQQMTVMQRCEGIVDRRAHFEAVTESLKRKHELEINSLQQQYDLALQKIKDKEDAQAQLENKLEEIERRHVATLLNKCDATVRQEATVKTLLDQANAEKLELTKKMSALQAECNMLRNDLEQYESITRLRLFNDSNSDEQDTDSMVHLGISKKNDLLSNTNSSNIHHSHNHYTDDMISKLKDELHRAIIGQRSKRHEIKKMQEQIQQKEMLINKMKEREQIYMNQVDTLKQEIANVNELLKNSIENAKEDKHTERIISLQTELQSIITEREAYLKQINTLENKIKTLEIKLQQEEMNKKRLADEYLEFHDKEIAKLRQEHEKLFKEKELEWSKKMDEILNENDEVKRLYIEIRSTKDNLVKKLEEESTKTDIYMKEREDFKLISEKLREDVKRLENHILGLNQDKRDLENKLDTLKKEYSKKVSSDDNAQNEVIIAPNENQINLEKMREEVALAKLKFIDLEKSMKLEYDERIKKLQAENKKLKEVLKEKEEKLEELRAVNYQCNKADAATLTEDNYVADVYPINERHLEEINQLQKEIDRIKTQELEKKQEILQMEFEYQKTIQNELQELEEKLRAKHQEELSSTEEKIKTFSVQYYTEEMNKLQENHKMQIEDIVKKYTIKMKEIENMLLKKEAEIQQTEKLKQQIIALSEQLELEKLENSGRLSQLIKELQEMKLKFEGNLKEIEELKSKLANARKKAITYKNALIKARNLIPQNFNAMTAHVQDKLEAINLKEKIVEKNLKAIEDELKFRR